MKLYHIRINLLFIPEKFNPEFFCEDDRLCQQTWDCERSIFGVLAAWSHLLVWRESIAALLKRDATCVSRSDGIAIPLLFAVKTKQ